MLTLKLISEETERVISGLEKKHFSGARETIGQVLAIDKRRREAQQQLDQNLSEAKKMAAQIGGLMKEGKKAEAEAIKAQVSAMKETNKQLEDTMNKAQVEVNTLDNGLHRVATAHPCKQGSHQNTTDTTKTDFRSSAHSAAVLHVRALSSSC
jgi:seryl-tRNA synthetase